MGIIIEHPCVKSETIYIKPEPQKLAWYDKKQIGSMANSQDAVGPAKETQHTM